MTDNSEELELKHFGILRKSGRYPWGSGKDSYSRSQGFYQTIDDLKRKGLSETEVATAIGLSVADLRSTRTIAKEQIVLEQTRRAEALREKGVSIDAIAKEMGIPKATVNQRLVNSEKIKNKSLSNTADVLRKNVDEHFIVDIGKGVEYQLGVKETRLRAAVSSLRADGYETYTLQVPIVGSKNMTNQKVMVPPGVTFGEAFKRRADVHTIGDFTENDGVTWLGIRDPISISSSRLKVKYAEDGGAAEDGVVYVRPGVKDLNMGKNKYAQVRIMVDGTHYIKGMAILKDDMPPGVDLVFNTTKPKAEGKLKALKEIKDDKDNPFGSTIKRQIIEIDPKTGKEKVTSAINIVNESGDWDDWRKSLPSQMLAKQPNTLIRNQLIKTQAETDKRIAEINTITNPIVRKRTLEKYAEQIDADAVDLRAASMPGQRTQVILPMPKMNKHEIYAPNFETGDKVVLIRYPHGGRFEIPEVVVNNNNRTAKKIIGNAKDAIGIHPSVAEKLSGADFDGDTVVVIPNARGNIKGSKSMGSAAKVYEQGLKGFEPKQKYGGYKEIGVDKNGKPIGNFPLMKNTGLEMGKITNLITDMSIQGAQPQHVIRAVRHSMVVIDAEKHKLDYKQSAIDNGIPQLKELYQGGSRAGASTLLSRATASVDVADRKLRPMKLGGPIDKDTGEVVYVKTGRQKNVYDPKTKTFTDEKVDVTSSSKRLAETKDARTLVRDKSNPVESMYAGHTNVMKGKANQARLEASRIKNPPMNPKAKKVYQAEVDSLVKQLDAAKAQKPLERRVNVIADSIVKTKRAENPTLREDREADIKVKRQAKAAARARLGIQKPVINISDKEWDAIQSGAVSSNRIKEILEYADGKRVKELSMPRKNVVMTSAVSNRAKALLAAGNTSAEVARALGVSPSTLKEAMKRGDV